WLAHRGQARMEPPYRSGAVSVGQHFTLAAHRTDVLPLRTAGPGRLFVLADCGVMSESTPDLHMLNVVVGDMAASLDFYRRLGIAVPGDLDSAGAHVQLRMPGGFSLELDTAESARLVHAGWRGRPGGGRVGCGLLAPDGGGGRGGVRGAAVGWLGGGAAAVRCLLGRAVRDRG